MPYLLQTTSSASLKDVTLSSGISYIRSGGAGYTGDWSLKFKCQINGTSLLILAGDVSGVADSTNLIFFTTGTNLQIRTAGAQRNLTLPQSAITAARVYELIGSSASNDIKVYQDGSYVGAVAGVSLFSTDVRVIYPLLNNTSRYGDLYYVELYNNGVLANHYLNTTGTGSVWIDRVGGNNATQTGTWPANDSEWIFYDDGGGAVPFEATLTKLSLSLSNKALQTSAGYANTLAKQEVVQDNKQLSSVAGYVDSLSKQSLALQNRLLTVQAGSAVSFIGEIGKLPLTLTGKQLAISAGYNSNVSKQDLVVDYKTNSLLAGFNSTLSEQSLVLANKQLTLVTGTSVSFVGELGKSGLNISSKLLETVTGTAIPYEGILQKTSLNVSYKLLDTTRGYVSELQKEALTLVSKDLSFGLPTYPIIPIERLFTMKADDGRSYLMKQTTTIYIMRK